MAAKSIDNYKQKRKYAHLSTDFPHTVFHLFLRSPIRAFMAGLSSLGHRVCKVLPARVMPSYTGCFAPKWRWNSWNSNKCVVCDTNDIKPRKTVIYQNLS